MPSQYKRIAGFFLALVALGTVKGWSSPAVWVKNIHVASTVQHAQVVLDVNQWPRDMVMDDHADNKVSIQFTGHLAKAVKAGSQTFTNANLQKAYWEERNGKVQVFLLRRSASAVHVVKSPNHLVIDLVNTYSNETEKTLTPGVVYRQISRLTSAGPLRINILTVDPKQASVSVEPGLADERMNSKALPRWIASRNGAIAAINGSFFKPDTGIPLGTLIINNELIAGPIFDRVALGITAENKFLMDRVSLKGSVELPGGLSIPIASVNQPRLTKDGYVLYTSRWGRVSPVTPTQGVQLVFENNKLVRVSNTPVPIPLNGSVLVGPNNPKFSALTPDQAVSVKVFTIPDWSNVKHAIGGGPYLVRHGDVYVDSVAQRFRSDVSHSRAPRTAVGITADQKLLLVTVDGRSAGGSIGLSLSEMATLMKILGSVDAMNLDGGGSTQMIVQGQVVNHPSEANGRAISNVLMVKPTREYVSHQTSF